MNRAFLFIKSHIILSVVVGLIVIGGIGYAFSDGSSAPKEFSTATVEKITLVQSVEETGSVQAETDLRYGFETSGKVAKVHKKVGEQLKTGDVIAELEGTVQLQSLRQAQAFLAGAQANLNSRIVGVSPEQIRESLATVERAKATRDQAAADTLRLKLQAEAKVQTAQTNATTAETNVKIVSEQGMSLIISNAYTDALNALRSTYPVMQDALLNADNVLGIDNNTANNEFERNLSAKNPQALAKANQLYSIAKEGRIKTEAAVQTILSSADQTRIDQAISITKDALEDMNELLSTVTVVLNATVPFDSFSQTELDALKMGVNTAQTSVNVSIKTVTGNEQGIQTAKTSLSNTQLVFDQAKRDLENAKKEQEITNQVADTNVQIQTASVAQAEAAHARLIAPPREVDVASLRADVLRQSAALISAQKEFDKTKLIAVTDGILASLDIDVGDIVAPNQAVATLLSENLQIKVDVSESDIAKLSAGDTATITFDAFGDSVPFTGKVTAIDPAQTEISGVVYYKTTVIFEPNEGYDVRPGMTANVRMVTDSKEDVLVVPQRAIITTDDTKTIRVVTNKEKGEFTEVTVTTGIRGDDGKVEITNGLSEGQEVITFLKEE
jgi:RND family efflux transporter MFP subunit